MPVIGFKQLVAPARVDDVEAAQRQQQLAQALQQRAMQGTAPQGGGPVEAKYGTGHALVDLANTLASAWNVNRANTAYDRAKEAKAGKVAEATRQVAISQPDMPMASGPGTIMSPLTPPEAMSNAAQVMGPEAQDKLAMAMMEQRLSETDPKLIADQNLRMATLAQTGYDRRADREQRAADNAARISETRAGRESTDALRRDIEAGRRADAEAQRALQKSIADQSDATRRAEIDRKIAADDAKRPEITDTNAATEFLKSIGYDAEKKTDDVSKLIPNSTGGWLQQKGADIAGAFNVTTSGRMALGKLKTRAADAVLKLLGGKLGVGVSNADREFMMQKVADIGNDSIPTDQRFGAWQDLVFRMLAAAGEAAPAARSGTIQRPGAPAASAATGGGWGKATKVPP